jgi:hypothetical protein
MATSAAVDAATSLLSAPPQPPTAAAGSSLQHGGVQSVMAAGLEDLFGKYDLADMMEKVCQELGVDNVKDLTYVEKKDVEALTWLKPIQQNKILRLLGLSGAEATERRECVVCFAGGSDLGVGCFCSRAGKCVCAKSVARALNSVLCAGKL